MRLISIADCIEDNVLSVDKNFTAKLSKDCILSTSGCVTSKGFEKAKVRNLENCSLNRRLPFLSVSNLPFLLSNTN